MLRSALNFCITVSRRMVSEEFSACSDRGDVCATLSEWVPTRRTFAGYNTRPAKPGKYDETMYGEIKYESMTKPHERMMKNEEIQHDDVDSEEIKRDESMTKL